MPVCKQCTMAYLLDGGECKNPDAKFCGAGVQPNPAARALIDFCCEHPYSEEQESWDGASP